MFENNKQVSQANVLADKLLAKVSALRSGEMLSEKDLRGAIADFLQEAKNGGKAATPEQIEEFLKKMKECLTV